MKILNGIAADSRDKSNAVYRQHPHFAFDALMESIETGKDTSAEVEQMVKDNQAEVERVLLFHVKQRIRPVTLVECPGLPCGRRHRALTSGPGSTPWVLHSGSI